MEAEGKGKIVPGTYQAPCHEDVWGSGGIVSLFLDHGTRWR
jgi:hypothetical protein